MICAGGYALIAHSTQGESAIKNTRVDLAFRCREVALTNPHVTNEEQMLKVHYKVSSNWFLRLYQVFSVGERRKELSSRGGGVK